MAVKFRPNDGIVFDSGIVTGGGFLRPNRFLDLVGGGAGKILEVQKCSSWRDLWPFELAQQAMVGDVQDTDEDG